MLTQIRIQSLFFPSEARYNVLYSFFSVDSGEENPQESKV